MGFSQQIVVTTRVEFADLGTIKRAAVDKWPFIRLPKNEHIYPDRILFAAPELTAYQFDEVTDYEVALEQNALIAEELPAFSAGFSDTTFLHIEAECFGGRCLYSGFCCQNGDVTFTIAADDESETGHATLLRQIEIAVDNYFAPFTRGFFSYRPGES